MAGCTWGTHASEKCFELCPFRQAQDLLHQHLDRIFQEDSATTDDVSSLSNRKGLARAKDTSAPAAATSSAIATVRRTSAAGNDGFVSGPSPAGREGSGIALFHQGPVIRLHNETKSTQVKQVLVGSEKKGGNTAADGERDCAGGEDEDCEGMEGREGDVDDGKGGKGGKKKKKKGKGKDEVEDKGEGVEFTKTSNGSTMMLRDNEDDRKRKEKRRGAEKGGRSKRKRGEEESAVEVPAVDIVGRERKGVGGEEGETEADSQKNKERKDGDEMGEGEKEEGAEKRRKKNRQKVVEVEPKPKKDDQVNEKKKKEKKLKLKGEKKADVL